MTTPKRAIGNTSLRTPAGWVDAPEKFPSCFTYLAKRKPAGAKARQWIACVRHSSSCALLQSMGLHVCKNAATPRNVETPDPALRAGLLSARAVQISGLVDSVALILLDKLVLQPGVAEPGCGEKRRLIKNVLSK
jgi:hypothetical protein